jgi:fatty-acid desaturase
MSESKYIHSTYNVSNWISYFVASVGRFARENVIAEYVRKHCEKERYIQ